MSRRGFLPFLSLQGPKKNENIVGSTVYINDCTIKKIAVWGWTNFSRSFASVLWLFSCKISHLLLSDIFGSDLQVWYTIKSVKILPEIWIIK